MDILPMNVIDDQSMRIIIVDDDLKYLSFISAVLSKFEYKGIKPHFERCINAQEAIDMLDFHEKNNELVAALILDYSMPDANGDFVIKHIWEHSKERLIQIILLTAQAGDELDINPIKNLEKFQIDDYLSKDTDVNERLPISLHNAIRIFESRLIAIKQRDEILKMHSLLSEYFTKKIEKKDKSEVKEIVNFLMKSICNSNQEEHELKEVASDAYQELTNFKNLNFRVLYTLVDKATRTKTLSVIDSRYVRRWAKDNVNLMIWIKNEDLLKKLHLHLIYHDMIEEIEFDQFQIHFIKGFIPKDPLIWKKEELDLLHLFFLLEKNKYLHPDFTKRKWIQLERHFETNHFSLKTVFNDCLTDGINGELNWNKGNKCKEIIEGFFRI